MAMTQEQIRKAREVFSEYGTHIPENVIVSNGAITALNVLYNSFTLVKTKLEIVKSSMGKDVIDDNNLKEIMEKQFGPLTEMAFRAYKDLIRIFL